MKFSYYWGDIDRSQIDISRKSSHVRIQVHPWLCVIEWLISHYLVEGTKYSWFRYNPPWLANKTMIAFEFLEENALFIRTLNKTETRLRFSFCKRERWAIGKDYTLRSHCVTDGGFNFPLLIWLIERAWLDGHFRWPRDVHFRWPDWFCLCVLSQMTIRTPNAHSTYHEMGGCVNVYMEISVNYWHCG